MSRDDIQTVIVTSTPRAGSTWVSRVLIDHPELQVYSHAKDDMWLLYLLYPGRMMNPWTDDSIADGNVLDRLLRPLRLHFASRLYRDAGQRGIRVLSSPTNLAFFPLFEHLFPDALYVHLQRNPMDVIASFKPFMYYSGDETFYTRYLREKHRGTVRGLREGVAHWFHQWRWLRSGQKGYIHLRPPGFFEGAELSGMEYLCWYYWGLEAWIEDLMARVPQQRRMRLSYDALVGDTRQELGRLGAFLGVPMDEAHIARTEQDARVPKKPKREDFSASERDDVERFLRAYKGRALGGA